MMNTYELKRERRIERLERAARLNREMAARLHASARESASMIPFGQPILVGHHSERRDRAYRSRIQRRFEKAFALSDKADYYARRAESARSNRSISSDDPEAVFKLGEKIAGLEKLQNTMKKVNALIRRFDLNTQKSECIKAIIDSGLLKEENAVKIVEPDFCGRVGFASFELTNNNANINRLKKRMEALTARRGQETTEQVSGDLRIVKNVEENRLQIFFPGKPSDEKRSQLKSLGFRWSPFNGCWQAYLNNRADYLINTITKGA